MSDGLNAAPELHAESDERRSQQDCAVESDPEARDPIDSLEIFGALPPAFSLVAHQSRLFCRPAPAELIRGIKDPEHPHTLEQLNVAQRRLIDVDDEAGRVVVRFSPTIPHCSMATLIGLCLRVKLLRSLPPRLKVDILITPGTHASEESINKQLNDKERVAAALENDHLSGMVNQCLLYRG
jgi:metal-sulfur cluster biosynthetic enzyme